jgi:hypothetical protein
MPVPALLVIVPSLIVRVTVRLVLSTSAKGVPVYVRFPARSSVNAKLAGAETVGASLTAVKLRVLVVVAVSEPSLTCVVSVRLVVLLSAPWYVIFPAVVKYVFRSDTVPAKVRAVAEPPTVMPVPALPVIVPSLMVRVTVRLVLSTSAKGVPVYVRFPATSSVNVKLTGAETVGASFTAVKLRVLVVVAVSEPSLTCVVSVRLAVLLRVPRYVIFPAVVK